MLKGMLMIFFFESAVFAGGAPSSSRVSSQISLGFIFEEEEPLLCFEANNGFTFMCRYAMEAISNAGSCIGVLTKEGVVLGAEKRITSKVSKLTKYCS
jgi:Proteasome subunit